MALEVDILAYRIPTFIAAVLTLLLAGIVMKLRPGARLHRAFAAFLFFRGGAYFALALNPAFDSVWARYSEYFFLGSLFASVWFATLFFQQYVVHSRRARVDVAGWILLVLGALSFLWYALDRTMAIGNWEAQPFVSMLTYVAWAAIALAMALALPSMPRGEHQRSVLLLSLGMLAEPAYRASVLLTDLTSPDVPAATAAFWRAQWPAVAAVVLVMVMVAAAVVVVSRFGRASGRSASAYGGTIGAATASGVFASLLARLYGDPSFSYRISLVALETVWLLLLVAITAYALLRCQLFGLELRVKRLVTGGTIAAPFAAVFFIGSYSLEEWAEARFAFSSYWIGLGAAAVIALGAYPLQRVAARFADRLFPGVGASDEYAARRKAQLYRAAVEDAVADQVITDRERVLLDSVRSHLELTPTQAEGLEKAVLASVLAAVPG